MWSFLLAGGILALDQITKAIVMASMSQNQSITVLGNLFRITYIHNPGAAFGLHIAPSTFHAVFNAVASIVISYFLVTLPKKEYWPRIALALVLAGALGNLVDRLRIGEVIDFIQVGLSDRLIWPIFNVADMGVSTGVVLLMLFFLVVGDTEESGGEIIA